MQMQNKHEICFIFISHSQTTKNSLSEIEKRERRAMERKLSELEEELKVITKVFPPLTPPKVLLKKKNSKQPTKQKKPLTSCACMLFVFSYHIILLLREQFR